MAYTGAVAEPTDLAAVDLLGINKPFYQNTLINQVAPEVDMDFYRIIKSLMWDEAVGTSPYYYFGNDYLWSAIQTMGGSGGSPTITLTLAASSISSTFKYFVQKHQAVKFQNDTVGVVTGLTDDGAGTVTITISSLGGVIPDVVSGDDLQLGNIMGSEDTTRDYKSIEDSVFRYSNTLGSVQTFFQASGLQIVNGEMWFDKDSDGTQFNTYVTRGLINAQIRHLAERGWALLCQQANTNTVLDPVSGNAYRATSGLIPEMQKYATDVEYISGMQTFDDFNAEGKILVNLRSGKTVMHFCGYVERSEYDGVLQAYFANANQKNAVQEEVEAKYFPDSGDDYTSAMLGSTVGFDYISVGGFKHVFKNLQVLDDTTRLAAKGYDGNTLDLIVPLRQGKMSAAMSANVSMPSFGCRHLSFDGKDRSYNVIKVDGTGIYTTYGGTLTDNMKVAYSSDEGFQGSSLNQAIYKHVA